MRLVIRNCLVITTACLVLAGCGRRVAPPAPPPPAKPQRVDVIPATPRDYVATASSLDLFVIQASELGQGRARSPRLRDLAAMLARDHRGTSAQLSFAGRRLNLLPSATMMPHHRAMFDDLNNSADFDASWRRLLISAHEQGVKLHGDYARAGESPTIRPVAEMAFPVMRRHLDELRGL